LYRKTWIGGWRDKYHYGGLNSLRCEDIFWRVREKYFISGRFGKSCQPPLKDKAPWQWNEHPAVWISDHGVLCISPKVSVVLISFKSKQIREYKQHSLRLCLKRRSTAHNNKAAKEIFSMFYHIKLSSIYEMWIP
jgi:hypothetical protein